MSQSNPKSETSQQRKELFRQLKSKRDKQKTSTKIKKEKIREEYRRQLIARKMIEDKCKNDLKAKELELKSMISKKQITKKNANAEYKRYRATRILELKTEEQKILNISSEELMKSFHYKMRRWFFGVGKEFSRVTWIGGKQILKDFSVIIIIVSILALIFLGLDYLFALIPKK